jgi:predicted MFS family arabinose efflux permease
VRFADETVSFLPSGALEPIRQDVDLTYVQAGFLLALFPGVGLIATPLGILADHLSRRLMAAIGGVGYGVGLWLFAFAESFPVLVLAVFVMGVLGDGLVRAVEVAMVDVAGDNLEPALARTNLLGAVGDLAGPLLLAGSLTVGFGWRGAFAVAGTAMVAYGVLLATQPLPAPTRADDAHPPLRGTLAVLRDRRVLVAALLVALVNSFDDSFVGFAVAFLITDHEVTPAVATLAAGAGLIGGIAAAAWASRTGRRPTSLRMCGAVLLAGVGVLLTVPNVVTAAVGTAAVGAATNLAWIRLQARYMRLRPGQAGTTSAVVTAVGQLAVLTPLAIGFIADRQTLTTAMLIYVAIALALLLATWRDRD